MTKELEPRAITNRLNKYFDEHYKDVDGLEIKEIADANKMKFFTATDVIVLISDKFGNITEQVKKRPNRKKAESLDKETKAKKQNEPIVSAKKVSKKASKEKVTENGSLNINNANEVAEQINEITIPNYKDAKTMPKKKKGKFKSGQLVKNIYNNINYQVLESEDNIVKVFEPNAKLYLCMASADVELVV